LTENTNRHMKVDCNNAKTVQSELGYTYKCRVQKNVIKLFNTPHKILYCFTHILRLNMVFSAI